MTVVELSSYHTADLETGPEVALVTNLFREHTDWHGSRRPTAPTSCACSACRACAWRSSSARDQWLRAELEGRPHANRPRADRRRGATGTDTDDAVPRLLRYGVADGWDSVAEGSRERRAARKRRRAAAARRAQRAQPVRRRSPRSKRSASCRRAAWLRWTASGRWRTDSRRSPSATACCGSTTASRPRPSRRSRRSRASPAAS